MRFIALFLALLAFVAQPALRHPRRACRALSSNSSSLVAGKSADVGIAALDLNTGETVSIKGNTPFPMASTVKVAVAALYLAQVDHGRRSLDDTIGGVPARRLMGRMLIHSDNRATDMLIGDLGGPDAVHDWLRTMVSGACASTATSPSCSAPSATCGIAAIPARRWRWSTCSGASTRRS